MNKHFSVLPSFHCCSNSNNWAWHRLTTLAIVFTVLCIFFFLPPVPLASIFAKRDVAIIRIPLPQQQPLSSSSLAPAVPSFPNKPWKTSIAHWFSRCYNFSLFIPVVETLSGRRCPNYCSNQGVCNRADGKCRCFHGYKGSDCQELVDLECNKDASESRPYGPWVVSICAASCDKRRAMCFCGAGTKYPERPVAEACGFILKGLVVDWTKPDLDNIFSNDSQKHGWCNVDARDGYAKKAMFKEQCDCKYDCAGGRFCEIQTQCVCINQCSGNGICRGGFCQCMEGWYGIDCSIPSLQVNPLVWPKWLRPSILSIPDEEVFSEESIRAVVQKQHPLIYVYDLPPQFNGHLLEGRHWKLECVNRIYDNTNATIWTDQLYGAEIALLESLLASPHRTTNGEEADYFYVPVLGACLITRADDAPHISMKNFKGLRSYLTLDLYRQAYIHISQSYPYWNRTAGRDHIWFFSWDEGACYAPKEIWSGMMLVHWGNTNMKYNYSTTRYFPDSWDNIPFEERGNHPCFDPGKDLVLPAWKRPDPGLILARLWERPRTDRKTLFYFNGNLGNAYVNGRPERGYSMGIRQKLASEFGSSPNKEGKLGRQATKDVTVTNVRSSSYSEELASSKFCGVLPGDGWSGRMEDSILHGCIPVIIQDGVQLIYENVLDYDKFALRIKEENIPQLVTILRALNLTEIDSKLSVIGSIWQRFLYRDSILLEAGRQRSEYNKTSDWAENFYSLLEDDAFSTFIQVLLYKMYNDPWRKGLHQGDEIPLSKECTV